MDGMKEARFAIENGQKLLVLRSSIEEYKALQNAINQLVSNEIDESIPAELLESSQECKTAVLGMLS